MLLLVVLDGDRRPHTDTNVVERLLSKSTGSRYSLSILIAEGIRLEVVALKYWA